MLDSQDSRPLYTQLADMLQKQIDESYQPDDQLPTEKELCEEYALSRTTVRLAMAELERRGSVYRVQGKGTFVSAGSPGGVNTLLDYDFCAHAEMGEQEGLTCVLDEDGPGGIGIATLQLFGTQRSQNVARADLRYLLRGTPVAMETVYMRTSSVRGGQLASIAAVRQSMAGLGSKTGSVRERYRARLASAAEREALGIGEACVLVVKRFIFSETGELLALLERRVLTDQVTYQNLVFTTTE